MQVGCEGLSMHGVRQSTLPKRTRSLRMLTLLPFAERSSAVQTVEPSALLVIAIPLPQASLGCLGTLRTLRTV